MRKLLLSSFVLLLCITFFPLYKASGADAETSQAIEAAENFLHLVDASQYAQSWDVASSFFKSQVPKETWVKQVSSLRPAFGTVANRQLLGVQQLTELPGAPDGKYVVIQYSLTCENKRKAIETITPMLDKDGKWRVSGYYIQ